MTLAREGRAEVAAEEEEPELRGPGACWRWVATPDVEDGRAEALLEVNEGRAAASAEVEDGRAEASAEVEEGRAEASTEVEEGRAGALLAVEEGRGSASTVASWRGGPVGSVLAQGREDDMLLRTISDRSQLGA